MSLYDDDDDVVLKASTSSPGGVGQGWERGVNSVKSMQMRQKQKAAAAIAAATATIKKAMTAANTPSTPTGPAFPKPVSLPPVINLQKLNKKPKDGAGEANTKFVYGGDKVRHSV